MLRTDWRTDKVHSYNPLPTQWRGIKKNQYDYYNTISELKKKKN